MNKGSASKTLDNIKWLLAIMVFAAAVIGNSYLVEVAFLYRVLGVLVLFILGLGLISITNFGINAIKLMEVRGAPLIGATAAYGLVLAIIENNDQSFLKKSAENLISSRPTAINLKLSLIHI